MFKHIILYSAVIAFVKAEGYYCPYESLGFDGKNDLLYDYYEGNGDRWVRMGRTGWETRESYCRAKGDLSLHSDAGEGKCVDSQGTCIWSGSSCDINQSKTPDCYELCKRVSEGGGLNCLGNCPGGRSDRSQLYSICNGQTNQTVVSRPRKRPSPREPMEPMEPKEAKLEVILKGKKKLICMCTEEV
jgi:hypothetical protein